MNIIRNLRIYEDVVPKTGWCICSYPIALCYTDTMKNRDTQRPHNICDYMRKVSEDGSGRVKDAFDYHADEIKDCTLLITLFCPQVIQDSVADIHKKASNMGNTTLVEELCSILNYIYTRSNAALLHLCEGYPESHHLATWTVANAAPLLLAAVSGKTSENHSVSFLAKKYGCEETSDACVKELQKLSHIEQAMVTSKIQKEYRAECHDWFAKEYPELKEYLGDTKEYITRVFLSGDVPLIEAGTLDDEASFLYPVDITRAEHKNAQLEDALGDFHFILARIFLAYRDTLNKEGYEFPFPFPDAIASIEQMVAEEFGDE